MYDADQPFSWLRSRKSLNHGSSTRVLPQGHAADVFEAYTQLLTEMVLRLPYQIKKIADTNSRIPPPVFDHSWFYFLSEVGEGPSRGGDMDCDGRCGPLAPQLARGVSPAEPLPPLRSCSSRVYHMVTPWELCVRAGHPL